MGNNPAAEQITASPPASPPSPNQITAGPPAAPAPASVALPPRRKPSGAWHTVKKVLAPIASLRLTVLLMALSVVLVFLGTLGMTEEGIWVVLQTNFRAFIAWIPYQALVHFGQVFFGVSPDAHVAGSFPFPGGWLLGSLLLVNLLAAHLVRFRISWRRSGILVLHAGLVVMMLSELVTGLFAVEGQMPISVGESVNYVQDARKPELAVWRPIDDKTDDVVVIPTAMLLKGGTISHRDLPFDVEVVQYMRNSELLRGTDPRANRGSLAERLRVEEREVIKGADASEREDRASAYVTFHKKDGGESLGGYLVTMWLDRPQTVTVDGKDYQVSLRPKRTYKPYTVHLKKFTHQKYQGTNVPKDFASDIRLTDAEHGEVRDVRVYMNNPLRYRGETFYQTGVLPGDSGTVLQVVNNPGWLMPYISCFLVALGMVAHFGLQLVEFLRRRFA
jgi:hypothetical protein